MSSCNREGRFSASNSEGVVKGMFLSEAAEGRDRAAAPRPIHRHQGPELNGPGPTHRQNVSAKNITAAFVAGQH